MKARDVTFSFVRSSCAWKRLHDARARPRNLDRGGFHARKLAFSLASSTLVRHVEPP